MLNVRNILPLVSMKKKPPAPLFGPDQLAGETLRTARLKICGACQYNRDGICRQCCGGTPIATLIHLTASRCARRFWKE